MVYSKNIKVRGYHCDAYGHVNNARYLEFFEEARWQALEEAKVIELITKKGLLFFIVHIDLTFKKSVENNAEVRIETTLFQHDRKTITFEQRMISAQNMVTTVALVRFVLFDTATSRALRLTEEHLALFKSFEPDKSI
ncbi:MAG: thioesterase-3 [Bacteroidia bacterium]|jgi:thioesterase-3